MSPVNFRVEFAVYSGSVETSRAFWVPTEELWRCCIALTGDFSFFIAGLENKRV